MLDARLIEKLQCPKTRSALRISSDQEYLECGDSTSRYPLVDGFPVFHGEDHISKRPGFPVDISVLIMAQNEAGNIEHVVSDVGQELKRLGRTYEIVVIDGASTDDTVDRAANSGARVLKQQSRGYAPGLIEGLNALKGRYVITLDGDCSHDSALIRDLLQLAAPASLVIGSRWMKGGSFAGPFHRQLLSRILSLVFTRILHIPVSDISSGYRLYARETLFPDLYCSKDFSILQEILVRARLEGFNLSEIPLKYKQRKEGSSHARLAAFAWSYLATLKQMWLLRHDANAADYDHRAYDSLNLIQRWWQRTRYKNIRSLMGDYWTQGEVLDVGCGSSRIIQSLPHAIAFDASIKKLRFLNKTNPLRVCGSALRLPFRDNSFGCVIHSQLIEHLPKDDSIFTELYRVIRPGGVLIMGTVDFGTWIWPTIERIYGILMPHAYAEEHISHYTLESLKQTLSQFGFRVEAVKDILRGEITVRATRL